MREQLQWGMWTSPVHCCRVFALKSNEKTFGQELWIIMACNYTMICAHHNQLCKLGNYGKKKKGKSAMNKNKYSVRCCIIFSLSLCNMFPKVASNAGHLPFWLPTLSENGLISRCAEKLQFALSSVGPVAAQPVLSLKAYPGTGLLQKLCLKELWLGKKKNQKTRKQANTKKPKKIQQNKKEQRSLNDFISLLLSKDCPKQWWGPCLRTSWMHLLSCGPAHPSPLLLLLHIPNP